jgi:hypothetical protein
MGIALLFSQYFLNLRNEKGCVKTCAYTDINHVSLKIECQARNSNGHTLATIKFGPQAA